MNDCNDNKNYTKTSNSRLGCFGLILICILSVIIVVFSPDNCFWNSVFSGVDYVNEWIKCKDANATQENPRGKSTQSNAELKK